MGGAEAMVEREQRTPEPDGRRILDSVFSSPTVIRRLAEQRAARLRGRKKRRQR